MNKIINLDKKQKIKKKYLNDLSNNLSSDLLTDLSNNLSTNVLNNNYKFNLINQYIFINKLYLNEDFIEKKELIVNLNAKINSYKQQDIKKNIYKNDLITNEELIEKLLLSKLICYYCKNKIYLFYINSREKLQWTLDRINNNINHSNINTLISCLDCNLKRRTKNKDHFLFTKQLKINKQL